MSAKDVPGYVVLCVPTRDGRWMLSISRRKGPRIGVTSPRPRAQGEHVDVRQVGSAWELVR